MQIQSANCLIWKIQTGGIHTSIDLSDSGYTQIGNPGDRYGSGAFQGCDQLTNRNPGQCKHHRQGAFSTAPTCKPSRWAMHTPSGGCIFWLRRPAEINLGNAQAWPPLATVRFRAAPAWKASPWARFDTIGDGAFAASGLTCIDLSNTQVTTILHDTFAGCHDLANVKLGKDLATIEGSGGIGSPTAHLSSATA